MTIELGYPFLTRVRFDTGSGGDVGMKVISNENAAASVVTWFENERDAD
jgi:hypothetical protein